MTLYNVHASEILLHDEGFLSGTFDPTDSVCSSSLKSFFLTSLGTSLLLRLRLHLLDPIVLVCRSSDCGGCDECGVA